MADIQNVELTDEQRKALSSFMPIKIDGAFKYVPKIYRETFKDKSKWPVFLLRPINGTEALTASDMMLGEYTVDETGRSKTSIQRGKYVIEICRKGIVGWSNYRDIDGNDLPFTKDLADLPSSLIDELSGAITENAHLSSEELLGLE